MRPYRIGLTGNIACGKTTVGVMLAERGAEYVDADQLAHVLMEPGTVENEQIVARFGADVRGPDGRIDRAALGSMVWHDAAALRDLEAIVHPGVRAKIRKRLSESSAPVVVVDAIKLIESGLYRELDAVWVVTCSAADQLRRLTERRALSQDEAHARIAAQPSQEDKVRHAAVVIDNSGTLAEMEQQVHLAWRRLMQERTPHPS